MDYLEFELKSRRKCIQSQKRNIKRCVIIGTFFPSMILLNIYILYTDITSIGNAISLGVVLACFIFYIVDVLMAIGDYKQDKIILGHYEKRNIELEAENMKKCFIDSSLGESILSDLK